jgi:hypothetical protein
MDSSVPSEIRILVSARVPSHFKRSLLRSGCPMYATPVHDIKAYKRNTGRAPVILHSSEWKTGHDYWYQICVVVIWAMTPCCLVGRYQHIGAILYPWAAFNVLGCFKAESRTLIAPSCTAEWTGMNREGHVRKRSCTNRGSIPEFEWMYRVRPRRNPSKVTNDPGEITTSHLPNRQKRRRYDQVTPVQCTENSTASIFFICHVKLSYLPALIIHHPFYICLILLSFSFLPLLHVRAV